MKTSKDISPYMVTDEIWMVPCLIIRNTNSFQPMSKPFDTCVDFHPLQSRQTWQPSEDEALGRIVGERGPKAWSTIAIELNKLVHQNIPIRQGKQCRERYYFCYQDGTTTWIPRFPKKYGLEKRNRGCLSSIKSLATNGLPSLRICLAGMRSLK